MKYNISIFCMLLSSVTLIHSADPRQEYNPKGMAYRSSIQNKTNEVVSVDIELDGGKVNPKCSQTITILPGKRRDVSYKAYAKSELFAGITIISCKPASNMSDSPIIGDADHEKLPSGVREIEDKITVQYAPGNTGVGIKLLVTRIYFS